MAINQNHPFEEIDGVRCAVAEKNCTPERVEFLKSLLEFNRYDVVVVESPPPKAAPAKPVAEGETPPPPPPPPPVTYTVAVKQNEFNVTNAIFGRLLRTKNGHIVTMKYWKQEEDVSNDSKPYFAKAWK